MKILVTGGCGFIASHLVDKLVDLGHKVTVLDPGKSRYKNPCPRYLRHSVEMIGSFLNCSYDLIYHLAALPRIQPSFKTPQKTYDLNSSGTIKVLEFARKRGGRVIYAGSSSCGGDVFANPYTYTKWLGEQHCKMYSKIYDVPTAIARFYNVYGPRQIDRGAYATVIGIFERQKREGLPLTITGDGKQRRDFCHVSDIVDGLVRIGESDWYGQQFDLGSGKNYSINQVATMFKSPVKHITARPGEMKRTLADISFARRMLKWQPKIKLSEYISSIVD